MLDRRHEYERMAAVEMEHWWYRSLHGLVVDAIRERFVPDRVAVLDAGCGTGGLLLRLKALGYTRVQGFDLSDDAVALCRERGLDVRSGDLRQIGKQYPDGAFDVIVSNDTLCYLSRDEMAQWARQCYSLLRSGGIVLCNLPALAAFGGIHDLSVGIRHRFETRDVEAIFCASHFQRTRVMYWPFLLSPLIYAIRLGQRLRLRLNPSVGIRSDVDLPPAWLNGVFLALTTAENRWLRRKPFGSSLFVVAAKMGGATP